MDRNALATLISSLFPYLASVIRRQALKAGIRISDADVDDLLMVVTEKALSGNVDADTAKAYLATLAHNATVDYLKRADSQVAYRAARVHSTDSETDGADIFTGDTYVSAERRMMARERLAGLRSAVETMGPADRALATALMADPEDFDMHTYAAQTGQTLMAVKVRMSRLRKTLAAVA